MHMIQIHSPDARILSKPLHPADYLIAFLFKLASHTAECFIQSTGGFPGGNHLHHEVWKNLRVLRHRNGEGLPALYGIPHFCDCVGKRFVLGLLG